MSVQILRICLIKRYKPRWSAGLIKEIRRDFHMDSPFSIVHYPFKNYPSASQA